MRCIFLSLIAAIIFIMAGAVKAQNIEFVGSFAMPSETRGVFIVTNYAYLIDWHNLYIIDISDAANPTLTSTLNFQHVNASAVYVVGNYAYVSSLYYSGLVLIDISNPADPAFVSQIHVTDAARNVFVYGDYAYIVGSFCDVEGSVGQLAIINISDPLNPTQAALIGFPNCIKGVFLSGSNIYTAQYNVYSLDEGFLTIVNSDPFNPFTVGELDSFHDAADVYVQGSYAFLVDGDLQIIDVTDTSNPSLTSRFVSPGQALDVAAAGNYAYLSDESSGVEVIDVSIPANPVIAAIYDTPGRAEKVFVSNDYIYVADSSSLQILRFNSTKIGGNNKIPSDFSLAPNYPNPFNPATTISYSIPNAMLVKISIYNIIGQKVARLDEGMQQAGKHSIKWDAEGYPSGIYFARLESGEHSQSIKMVLLK